MFARYPGQCTSGRADRSSFRRGGQPSAGTTATSIASFSFHQKLKGDSSLLTLPLTAAARTISKGWLVNNAFSRERQAEYHNWHTSPANFTTPS